MFQQTIVIGNLGQDPEARCSLTLTAQTVKFLGAGKGGQDVEAHADQPAEDDCPF